MFKSASSVTCRLFKMKAISKIDFPVRKAELQLELGVTWLKFFLHLSSPF